MKDIGECEERCGREGIEEGWHCSSSKRVQSKGHKRYRRFINCQEILAGAFYPVQKSLLLGPIDAYAR